MMYSSTLNLKICLYKLTTFVRIPLDMEFFLLYMVFHSWEIFNISLPTAHYDTHHVDRDTKVEGCDAHDCSEQNKTINPSHTAIKITVNATAAEFNCENIFPTPVQVKKKYKK